jgi:hypothetical protein
MIMSPPELGGNRAVGDPISRRILDAKGSITGFALRQPESAVMRRSTSWESVTSAEDHGYQ